MKFYFAMNSEPLASFESFEIWIDSIVDVFCGGFLKKVPMVRITESRVFNDM